MGHAASEPAYDAWRKAVEVGAAGSTPAPTIYKQFGVEVEPGEGRTVTFKITTVAPDRERDVVSAAGIDTGNYERNPIVLFAHDYRDLPIARTTSLQRDATSISATAEFATADLNPRAEQVYRMVKAGFLNAASIGFRPLEWAYNEERRGVDFARVELLEWSVVPVPAHPMALVEARAAGFDAAVLKDWAERTLADLAEQDDLGAVACDKGVSPRDVSTVKAPADQAWSAPALADFTDKAWGDLSDAEKRRIAGHYAWAAAVPPESFADLKLPHHDAANGHVVWRGVVAAAGRLGQADIPEGDVAAVKAHLRRHYKQFDQDAPEALKGLLPPFDRDEVGWRAYARAYARVQRKAGDAPLADAQVADLFADYGFDAEAEVLRAAPAPAHAALSEDETAELVAGYCARRGLALVSRDLLAEVQEKRGRALSRANEDKLRKAVSSAEECMAHVNGVLASLDPAEEPDAETDDVAIELVETRAAEFEAFVIELDEAPADDVIEIDAGDLAEAIQHVLGDICRRETAAAINALRGRID